LASSKDNSAFALLLLIILVAVAAVALVYYPANSASEGTEIGGLQIQSTSVSMAGMSHSGLGLNLDAVVYNPNTLGATLDRANYSVYVDGQYFGTGRTAREYSLAPQSSQTLVFPVSVGWKSAFRTVGSYVMDGGKATWKVNGTATIALGGIPFTVPFDFLGG